MITTNQMPFIREGNLVLNSQGKEVCTCVGLLEAKDVTDALNLWGLEPVKKEEPMRVTLQPGEGPTPEHPPTPNQKETDIPSGKPCSAGIDRVASDFVLSGRELDVQFFADGRWVDVKADGVKIPSFHYSHHWRIKPAKRRVVVEIWKTQMGDVVSRISNGNPYIAGFKLLGTIEGEVEA